MILNRDSYDLWLDPGMKDVATVSELLRPCDARLIRCFPVSSRVNSVINDNKDALGPQRFPTINEDCSHSCHHNARWF